MAEPDALDFKIRDIGSSICELRLPIKGWEMQPFAYAAPGEYRALAGPVEVATGMEWDNSGTTCVFSCRLQVPEELLGQEVYLELDPGGESMLYVDGQLKRGINERYILLSPAAAAEYALRIEAFRDFQKGVKYPRFFEKEYPHHYFKTANLVVKNRAVEEYYYLLKTVKAALDSPDTAGERDEEARSCLEGALQKSLQRVIFFTPDRGKYLASIEEADRVLNHELQGLSARRFKGLKEGRIFLSGHSHLDLAYKWPIKETIRKAARTLATVVELLGSYQGLYFVQSQPQIFAYLKEYYPCLYRRVKDEVKTGRLQPVGAMWVETDTNLISGESLVRQLIYGQRFLQEEFGLKSEICWLPDSFGYSGALPQILKKAGLEFFFSSKLTWNDTNQFPHNLLRWQGIDGTSINAYLLPRGYGGKLLPGELSREWRDFREKKEGGEVLYLYGYGDGGGGVTADLLDTAAALEKVPRLPELKTGPIIEHFRRVFSRPDSLPSWRGELYFEKHRGVYTSQAELKKRNRKSEFLYREAEVFAVLASLQAMMAGGQEGLTGKKNAEEIQDSAGKQSSSDSRNFTERRCSPADAARAAERNRVVTSKYQELQEGWRLILKNQFHDILPGSCIGEVVEDARADYRQIEKLGRAVREESLNYLISRLAEGLIPYKADNFKVSGAGLYLTVFNSLSWSRSGLVKLELPEELTDSGKAKGPGSVDVRLIDEQGKVLPVQAAAEGLLALVEDIPSFGCRIYRIVISPRGAGDADFPTGWRLAGDSRTGRLSADISGGSPREGEEPEKGVLKNEVLENEFFSLQFNSRGHLISIYDKTNERELIPAGEEGNQLQIFEDKSTYFDTWDLNISEDKMWVIDEVEVMQRKEEGPVCSSVFIKKRFNRSSLEQEIVIYHGIPRIDFRTRVDWQERQMLLKAAFPLEIVTDRASYDIAFGNLERPTHNNTSWERARSEVPAHKWADLSETGYGVSLLNDCKYGYDIKGNRMRLTLLKGGIFPDPHADLGEHAFTYSLYPHQYDFRRGGTVRAGYNLNQPLLAGCFTGDFVTELNTDNGDDSVSSIGVNKGCSFIEVEGENVILETVKGAEDGCGFIFRFYEAWGARSTARLRAVLPPVEVVECNLLEEPLERGGKSARLTGSGFSFELTPYEVKTFRVRF